MNKALWQSPDLPALLAADLTLPPQRVWRTAMSPQLAYGRHDGPPRGDARPAAVAIILCWEGAEWAIPLTVRSANLGRHGGQVSLPGGLMDPQETPQQAALRELEEELGICPQAAVLGALEPLFVFASNAVVTPCILATDHWPAWRANPAEVERVLKLEASSLINAAAGPPLEITRGLLRFFAPQLIVEGHATWGATAVMLGELQGRLRRTMGRSAA
ncbi:MAG: CoA pyrophosphatase [Pirellulales bacterium]|nr:CoA pyrophosphatase [Pirellulales bacterium]